MQALAQALDCGAGSDGAQPQPYTPSQFPATAEECEMGGPDGESVLLFTFSSAADQ